MFISFIGYSTAIQIKEMISVVTFDSAICLNSSMQVCLNKLAFIVKTKKKSFSKQMKLIKKLYKMF